MPRSEPCLDVPPTDASPGIGGDEDRPLLAEAERLAVLLRANAAETERRGRLPAANSAALRTSGFLTLLAPHGYGGRATELHEAFEVYAALAHGCASSAWVSMILSGSALVASLFGDRARAEVWHDDPHAAVCSSSILGGIARRQQDGVRVSGRWQTMSGIYESQWALVATAVQDEQGGPLDPGIALVPVHQVSIEKTWNVAGMRGTGSETAALRDVFVPEHRLLSLPRLFDGGYAAGHPDEPLCGATVKSLLTVTTIAPVLGAAEASLRHVKDSLDERMSAAGADCGSVRFRTVQIGYAEAVSLLDLARLSAGRAVADVERGIRAKRQLDLHTRARIAMDVATAARHARDAVDRALSLNGSRSFADDNPLQRLWRDLEVATRHTMMSQDRNRDLYAQVLFGATDFAYPA